MRTLPNLTSHEAVAQRRSELSMTQRHLAQALGYENANFISMIEKGKSRVPMHRMLDVATVLQLDPLWFCMLIIEEAVPDLAGFLRSRIAPEPAS